MTRISNNLHKKDYLDKCHTTSKKNTPKTAKINDNPNIEFPVIYKKGRIHLTVPKKYFTAVNNKCFIYTIIRNSDKKQYIGKTCNLRKRMYAWNGTVNNSNNKKYYCPLAKAMRQSYTANKKNGKYTVKLLEACHPLKLDEREDYHINAAKAAGKVLFNVKGGGGGGTAHFDPPTSEPITEEFKTPSKEEASRYPIVLENGVFKVLTTPSTKKDDNSVYQVMHVEKPIRLVGATTRNLAKRIGEYEQAWNNPNHSKTDGIGKAKKLIQKSPTKYVFVRVKRFDDASTSGAMEEAAVKAKKNQKKVLLNCTNGRNGPASRKSLLAAFAKIEIKQEETANNGARKNLSKIFEEMAEKA